MPTNLVGVTIMLSGPGDTANDIDVITDVIHKWNDNHGAAQKLIFLPVHYLQDVVPVYQPGADGQIVINQQITEKSDVVLCVFRHRLGTPTPRSGASGTVEEADIGQKNGFAHVLFWNGDIPRAVASSSSASAENQRLENFRASFETEPKGLYGLFESELALRAAVERILWSHVPHFAPSDAVKSLPESTESRPALTLDVLGPVWAVSRLDHLIRICAKKNANGQRLSAAATDQYIAFCLDRATELEEEFAANAGHPIVVGVSTDATRVVDLRVEIIFSDVCGVDPEDKHWKAVWQTPAPQTTSDPYRIGSDLQTINFDSPSFRGTMQTWPERASWTDDDGDTIVHVEIDDLRRRRTATRVTDDVVLWLPNSTDDAEDVAEVQPNVTYSWEASGTVEGRTETWQGEGIVESTGMATVIERMLRWRGGEDNRPE